MDSCPTDFYRIPYPDGSYHFMVMVHVVVTESGIYTTYSRDRLYSYISDCLSLGEPHQVSNFYIMVKPNLFANVFESCKNSES